ncbi:MAG TPA: MBL fold metallo-hydrolase [Kofleriaceae bacterium]|jgi:L-ascorbate metabolism protein UlaG (beta-lactamase superfamily)
MRVTLLGHASIFVEMKGVRCLMDPVFQDPFEDTAVVSCPRRTIHLDAIPAIDLLVISHCHLDHFDIPSLAYIAKKSRNCDVVCPKDHTIVYALEQLGFTKIHPEAPHKHFKLGGYELLTTHSNVTNVTEIGIVFKDASGTFWNQVDTVISAATATGTVKQVGDIDLLFAMYASQNFDFFASRGTSFPHQMHAMNLNNVMAIRPCMTVPGSAGFRFAGAGMEWCNAFLFPMSRERFVADLARVAPELKTCLANPGDIFEIERGKVKHHVAASPIARMQEDDTRLLRFDPTATIPPLQDPNPGRLSTQRLIDGVEDCVTEFVGFVRAAYRAGDPVVDEYRRLRASYAVGVVFDDGTERWIHLALGPEAPEITRGDNHCAPADAGHRIVASALTAWAAREKSYFYLRAFSRQWSTLYALSADGAQATVAPTQPQDLLAYFLLRKAKGAELAVKLWLDHQLAQHLPCA